MTRESTAAACVIGLVLGLIGAVLIARGGDAGADAHAYWGAVNRWLAGQDPLDPPQGFLPYLYAPWLLIVFLPWALLPWSIAWPLWRGLNLIVLALAIGWAYRRRPLATAVVIVILAVPLAVTLDTGNVTLLLSMAVWAAQFLPPAIAGALWALATSMKWYPVLLLGLLSRPARRWGVLMASLAVLLSIVMWPQTVAQVRAVLADPRPSRIDYLLLALAAVPWLWRHAELTDATGRAAARTVLASVAASLAGWRRARRTGNGEAPANTRRRIRSQAGSFLGFR